MSWLRAIIAGLFDALFGWGQKQREKPPTATDANTPKEIVDPFNKSIADFVRNKDNDVRK